MIWRAFYDIADHTRAEQRASDVGYQRRGYCFSYPCSQLRIGPHTVYIQRSGGGCQDQSGRQFHDPGRKGLLLAGGQLRRDEDLRQDRIRRRRCRKEGDAHAGPHPPHCRTDQRRGNCGRPADARHFRCGACVGLAVSGVAAALPARSGAAAERCRLFPGGDAAETREGYLQGEAACRDENRQLQGIQSPAVHDTGNGQVFGRNQGLCQTGR